MKIVTSMKVESFTKSDDTQGITLKPIYEDLTDVAYYNCKLVKVNRATGERLVHKSNMGIILEWSRIEALGTVYPVAWSSLSDIIKTLESTDSTCYYDFI